MTSEDEPGQVYGQVYGGVDTHEGAVHVAVIGADGRDLDDREFPTTPAGYRRALAFILSYGEPIAVGIEGTSSYGGGLARFAIEEGFVVVEVVRPERAERRRLGKTDPIDAYQAARAAMGTEADRTTQGRLRALTLVLGHAESSICCWGSEMIQNYGQEELLRGVPSSGRRLIRVHARRHSRLRPVEWCRSSA